MGVLANVLVVTRRTDDVEATNGIGLSGTDRLKHSLQVGQTLFITRWRHLHATQSVLGYRLLYTFIYKVVVRTVA